MDTGCRATDTIDTFSGDAWRTLDKLALDQIAMLLGAHVLQRYSGFQRLPHQRGVGCRPGKSYGPRDVLAQT